MTTLSRGISTVKHLLQNAIDGGLRLKNFQEQLSDFHDEIHTATWGRGLCCDSGVFTKLCSVLAEIPEVVEIEGRLLIPGVSGTGETVSFGSLAWWLLERSLKASVIVAINDFRYFLKRHEGHSLWVSLLYGLKVSAPTDLGLGFRLIPFDHLPTSRQKRAFGRRHSGGGFLISNEPAALTYAGKSGRILFSPDYKPKHEAHDKGKGDWTSPAFQLQAVGALFTLLSDRGPLESGSWVQASGRGVPSQGAQSYTWSLDPLPHSMITIDPVPARNLIKRFFRMSECDRIKLMVPLHRLGQSQRQLQLEDAFIDLRTCLESALLEGADGELSYQLAVRGAWLIGKDNSSRKEIFAKLKKAYGAGSKAVHTGSVGGKRDELWRLLLEAQQLARLILKAFITGGKKIELKSIIFG
jgi:hypothetical protein